MRGRMPEEPEAIRELAVAQWTRTVAFRETIESMHADGLRLFIDVGARGNLAGFVQDTLRGRQSFAIAANVPRRSGLTQLNHLVAALFAQGVSFRPGYLYVRRRPRLIDWSEPESPRRATVAMKLGFPAMSLSEATIDRLRSLSETADAPTGYSLGACLQAASQDADRLEAELQPNEAQLFPLDSRFWVESAIADRLKPELQLWKAIPSVGAHPATATEVDDAMIAFQETMRVFLETQQKVIAAYLASPRAASSSEVEDSGDFHFYTSSEPLRNEGNGFPTVSGQELGPWVGDVHRLVAGSELEAVCWIDRHGDPIAENHTLGGRRVSALDPTLMGLPVLPFAVMAEMAVEAAALLVAPGLVLTGLNQVRAAQVGAVRVVAGLPGVPRSSCGVGRG